MIQIPNVLSETYSRVFSFRLLQPCPIEGNNPKASGAAPKNNRNGIIVKND